MQCKKQLESFEVWKEGSEATGIILYLIWIHIADIAAIVVGNPWILVVYLVKVEVQLPPLELLSAAAFGHGQKMSNAPIPQKQQQTGMQQDEAPIQHKH